MATERKKGHFTFRTAAVLLMVSAALELLSVASEVPLFGEVRVGISAGIYHIVYIALFLALGIGLWGARKWGYTLVFVTTALYTLDKLQLVLGSQALEAFVKAQMSGFESQLQSQGINEALIMQVITMMAVIVVLCWWGFALYTYWRRDYFNSPERTLVQFGNNGRFAKIGRMEGDNKMGTKQSLGLIGSIVLFVGVFAPLVNVPIMGSMNYFQNGKGDGVIILILAAVSFFLVLSKKFKGLWFTGLGSIAVMAFTFINFQMKMSDVQTKMDTQLADNPFKELANLAVQSVQLQWGWALLIVGAALVIASAAIKEE